MKRFSLLLASAAFVTPAMAADAIYDVPPAPPAPAPVEIVAPVGTWSGLYIGGQAGVAFNGDDEDGFTADPENDGVFEEADFDDGDDSNAGFVGGAHIGYDQQFGNFVLGAVADINYIDAETTRGYSLQDDNGVQNFTVTDEIDYFGTVRGRLGYALDSVLLYGTGGLAYAGIDRNFSGPSSVTVGGETFTMDGDGEEADFGYSVGGGVDFMATQNISFGVEYLYNNLGSNDFEVTGADDDGDEISFESNDDDLDFHTVWAKASYRFN